MNFLHGIARSIDRFFPGIRNGRIFFALIHIKVQKYEKQLYNKQKPSRSGEGFYKQQYV